MQSVAQLVEESTHRLGTDSDAQFSQLSGELPQTLAGPESTLARGVSGRVLLE